MWDKIKGWIAAEDIQPSEQPLVSSVRMILAGSVITVVIIIAYLTHYLK
jgi:hypothetical protein